MTLKKISQAGVILWSDSASDSIYPSVAISGVGVPPAVAEYSGLVNAITGTATKIVIVSIIPAQVEYGGIDLEIEGHERIIAIVSAEAEYSILATVGHGIPITPATVEYSGLAPVVAFTPPMTVPATVEYGGIPITITGHERIITFTPAEAEYGGIDLIIYVAYAPFAPDGVVVQIVPAEVEYGGIDLNLITSIASGLNFYTVYRCTLSGANDGLDDLILKISSFTSRLRSGTPTYCGVIVPNAVLNADAVNSRPNGQLIIDEGRFFSGGTNNYSEIVRVDLESTAYDTGARNSSMSLSGHITETTETPKTVDLSGSVFQESVQANGLIRIKTGVNFLVKPDDTILWDSGLKSMIAGLVTINVGKTAYMDITEAST